LTTGSCIYCIECCTWIAGPQVRFLPEDLVFHFLQPFLVRYKKCIYIQYRYLDYPSTPISLTCFYIYYSFEFNL
jgi:hypothetical protein